MFFFTTKHHFHSTKLVQDRISKIQKLLPNVPNLIKSGRNKQHEILKYFFIYQRQFPLWECQYTASSRLLFFVRFPQAKQVLLDAGWFEENINLHIWASMFSWLATTIAYMPVDIAETRYVRLQNNWKRLPFLENSHRTLSCGTGFKVWSTWTENRVQKRGGRFPADHRRRRNTGVVEGVHAVLHSSGAAHGADFRVPWANEFGLLSMARVCPEAHDARTMVLFDYGCD